MQSTLFFMPLKIRDGEDGMLLNPLALSDLAASTLFLGCSLYGAGFRVGVVIKIKLLNISSSIRAFQQHMKPIFNISFPTLLSTLFILYFQFMKQFLSQVAFNISSSLVFVHQQRNAIAVLHCTVAVQNRPQAPKVFNSVKVDGLFTNGCADTHAVYRSSNLKVVDKRVRLAELVLRSAMNSLYCLNCLVKHLVNAFQRDAFQNKKEGNMAAAKQLLNFLGAVDRNCWLYECPGLDKAINSSSTCAFQQHMKPFFNISFPTFLSTLFILLYFRFMKQFLSHIAFYISSSHMFVHQHCNAIV
nr:glycine-rich domain-containing protein 2 isoform X1 [Ipomoea batatas]